MGWRGAIRSFAAAQRRAARESERQRKAEIRDEVRRARSQAIKEAEDLVGEIADYLMDITGIHRDASNPVDWQQLAALVDPVPPVRRNSREARAAAELAAYRPGLLTRLFGNEASQRARLQQMLEVARHDDSREYASLAADHDAACAAAKDMRELAAEILSGNREAALSYIKDYEVISDIQYLGRSLSVNFNATTVGRIELFANSSDLVPRDKVSLLKSGKLSKKEMPIQEYWRLHQDHVCSALLRATREIFSCVPFIDAIDAAASLQLLNSSTGHREETKIIAAFFPRRDFERINFRSADASDCLMSFKHSMNFKAKAGFLGIE